MVYGVSMKEMNDKMFLSVEEEEDMEMVEVQLMDDGDWEYVRMGVGVMNGRVFVVDLDDGGEEWREMNFVKEGLSVEDEELRFGQHEGASRVSVSTVELLHIPSVCIKVRISSSVIVSNNDGCSSSLSSVSVGATAESSN